MCRNRTTALLFKKNIESVGTIVSHKGVVLFIEGHRIDIEMEVQSACSACRAQKACGMLDNDEKIISLHTESAPIYQIGEEVVVSMEERKGVKAAVYSYMIPFFIMIGILLVSNELGFSELVSAISALASFVIYNVVLFFFRGRIEKEMMFKLEKIV